MNRNHVLPTSRRVARRVSGGSLTASLSTSAALAIWLFHDERIGLSTTTLAVVLGLAELGTFIALTVFGPMAAAHHRRRIAGLSFASTLLLVALWLVRENVWALGATGFLLGVTSPIVAFARPPARLAGWTSATLVLGYLAFRLPVLLAWREGTLVLAAAVAVAGLLALGLPDDRDADHDVSWRETMLPLGRTLKDRAVGLVGGAAFRGLVAVQPLLVLEHAGGDHVWVVFQATNVVATIAVAWWGTRVRRSPGATLIAANALLLATIVTVPLLPELDGTASRSAILGVCTLADAAANMAMVSIVTAKGKRTAKRSVARSLRVLAMAVGAFLSSVLYVTELGEVVAVRIRQQPELPLPFYVSLGLAALATVISVSSALRSRRRIDLGAVAVVTKIRKAEGGCVRFERGGMRLEFSTNTQGGRADAEVTLPIAGLIDRRCRVGELGYLALVGAWKALGEIDARSRDIEPARRTAAGVLVGKIAEAAVLGKGLDDAFENAAAGLADAAAAWRGLDEKARKRAARLARSGVRVPLAQRIAVLRGLVIDWHDAAVHASRPAAEPGPLPLTWRGGRAHVVTSGRSWRDAGTTGARALAENETLRRVRVTVAVSAARNPAKRPGLIDADERSATGPRLTRLLVRGCTVHLRSEEDDWWADVVVAGPRWRGRWSLAAVAWIVRWTWPGVGVVVCLDVPRERGVPGRAPVSAVQ